MKLTEQHLQVTAALIVREMSTRYGSKHGGYLWAVFDPVVHMMMMMMTLIFQAVARMPALSLSFPLKSINYSDARSGNRRLLALFRSREARRCIC